MKNLPTIWKCSFCGSEHIMLEYRQIAFKKRCSVSFFGSWCPFCETTFNSYRKITERVFLMENK